MQIKELQFYYESTAFVVYIENVTNTLQLDYNAVTYIDLEYELMLK